MTKKLISILSLATLAIASTAIVNAQDLPEPAQAVIIEIQEHSDIDTLIQSYNIKPKFIYKNASHGLAGTIPTGILKKMESDPSIKSITPDRKVSAYAKPDKPGKPGNGGGGSTAQQTIPSGVARIGATPGTLQYTGQGIGVAVVDTGVDYNHADLNISPTSFSAHTATGQDDEGHGTHVAGIIAALNNSQDTVGVAPAATIYPVKVLDSTGSGYDSDVIAGLDWVAANHNSVSPSIKVINMSLGRPGSVNDNPIYQATLQNLNAAGITIIAAAGNDQNLEVSQNIPAAYPEVIAVASTTAEDGVPAKRGQCAGFSIPADTASYFTTDGPNVVISAPGARRENVKNNCNITSEGILSLSLGGGTIRHSGTSMASPHVAGVAALLYQKNPSATPIQIQSALSSSASNIGSAPLNSPTSNYTFDGIREGILNATGALAAIN